MLENLTILAIIIILFWLGALLYYYVTATKQSDIQQDLDKLRRTLDDMDDGAER